MKLLYQNCGYNVAVGIEGTQEEINTQFDIQWFDGSIVHTITDVGSDQILGTGFGQFICWFDYSLGASELQLYRITEIPTATIISVSPPSPVPNGASISFEGSGSPSAEIDEYRWFSSKDGFLGNGNLLTIPNPSHPEPLSQAILPLQLAVL